MPSSRLAGLHQQTRSERAQAVQAFAGLSQDDLSALSDPCGLALDIAESMIENVVGVYGLPLGIATNFLVNGRDHLIPLVVEEPSIVAGLSYAAKLVRQGGGFTCDADAPEMIGQLQILDVADPQSARLRLLGAKQALLAEANRQCAGMVARGGGARDLSVRVVTASPVGPMLVLDLILDTRDAMGANTINTTLEALAPMAEDVAQGRVALRILSNLSDRRKARASALVPKQALAREGFDGDEAVTRILEAHAFAEVDVHRAATHNKGIMNGIDAVALATGNDWRAIEAGAHAYAARDGRYGPLTHWERNAQGDLAGSVELPMAVGTVGGATQVLPKARLALKILGVETAGELAGIMAAVGLAQNLAALRALAMEGIQRGHMRLHARQLALAAGATGDQLAVVVQRLIQEHDLRASRAKEILAELGAAGATE